MKKNKFSQKIIVLIFLIISSNLFAQSDLSINGYIQTDNRIRLDNGLFSWNENRLDLKFEGAPSDKYHFFSEVRLRGFGFPNVNRVSDLQMREKDKVYTWGLEFREAYLDLYQFGGLENLDIRVGRQIIVWGTADKINPTNNISPDDLEDIFNFGEQLGTNAIKADYYLDDVTLTGVYVPIFTPATLPFGDYSQAFVPEFNVPPGMTIRNVSDKITLPETKLSETSQFAFKVATNLFDYDLSLSYYNGRDDFPLANKIIITPVDTLGTVDVQSGMVYPKMQVVGADFSGSIYDIGFWGEGAMFIPDKIYMNTYIQTPMGLNPIEKSIALDDEPYFKYVLGCDYTFSNSWYVNAQFIHGFIHERGKNNLNDYIAFRFEKKFFNDKLKVVPLGGVVTVTDWGNMKDNYGIAGTPEITYYPSDNVELILGAFIMYGEGDNMFSRIQDQDELYLRAKVSF